MIIFQDFLSQKKVRAMIYLKKKKSVFWEYWLHSQNSHFSYDSEVKAEILISASEFDDWIRTENRDYKEEKTTCNRKIYFTWH